MIWKSKPKTIGLGLIGLGTVGSGVVKILHAHARALAEKTGARLELRRIAVRSISKKRAVSVPKRLLTTSADQVLRDPSVDIVIELMGGVHPAKEILLRAFKAGKHVVTANKALLAEEGAVIFAAAERGKRRLGIEASVCGGIPIIKSVREGLVSNEISRFLGIVNGTCNYILTAMSKRSLDFKSALKEAQVEGYAEANPGLDIDGVDSAHKLAVLARLAFGADVPFKSISVEGIRSLSADDIAYAYDLGYVIKLLAVAKRGEDGLDLRVHPTMLPFGHPLSNVWDAYNAVLVHGDQAGDLLFYGKGAGMMPTASAVMSDVVDIAKAVASGSSMPPATKLFPAKLLPLDEVVSKYYLRFQVVDRPGVLGKIAQTLGQNRISILSVHQKESRGTGSTPVIILTYEAREKDVRRALRTIDAQKSVSRKTVVIRVEK